MSSIESGLIGADETECQCERAARGGRDYGSISRGLAQPHKLAVALTHSLSLESSRCWMQSRPVVAPRSSVHCAVSLPGRSDCCHSCRSRLLCRGSLSTPPSASSLVFSLRRLTAVSGVCRRRTAATAIHPAGRRASQRHQAARSSELARTRTVLNWIRHFDPCGHCT